MSTEPKAPIRGRHLEALRAVAENPGGLRHEAYPTVMPILQELGYVEERATRGRAPAACVPWDPRERSL